jgi:hypothetical protein
MCTKKALSNKGSCAQLAAEEAQELSYVEAAHVCLGYTLDQQHVKSPPAPHSYAGAALPAVVQAFTPISWTATSPWRLPTVAQYYVLYVMQVHAVLQNAIDKLALMSVLLVDPR